MTQHEQNILTVRRMITLMKQQNDDPKFRDNPRIAEIMFELGFKAALDQQTPVLDSKLDIASYGKAFEIFYAELSEIQKLKFNQLFLNTIN